MFLLSHILLIYFINVFVAKLGTAATGNFLTGKREGGGKLQAVNSDIN
jgi:hypothetical protein